MSISSENNKYLPFTGAQKQKYGPFYFSSSNSITYKNTEHFVQFDSIINGKHKKMKRKKIYDAENGS